MFKQLTNARPAGTSVAELTTTTTPSNMKINEPASSKMGLAKGDYVTVLEDTDTNSEYHGTWITKGAAAVKNDAGKIITPQVGAALATIGKGNSSSLSFSSALAYQSLNGNEKTKVVYSIGDAVNHPDLENPIYKLEFLREEEKSERKSKDGSAE